MNYLTLSMWWWLTHSLKVGARNVHMVESLISLKWWGLWLSSHGNCGNTSYMGLVVKSLSLSIWWHKSLKSSYVAVVEGKIPCSTISSSSPWIKAEDGTSSLSPPKMEASSLLVVGVLGTGVPRLACLRPAAWLKWGPSAAHLHQLKLKTLARGQASRGG